MRILIYSHPIVDKINSFKAKIWKSKSFKICQTFELLYLTGVFNKGCLTNKVYKSNSDLIDFYFCKQIKVKCRLSTQRIAYGR